MSGIWQGACLSFLSIAAVLLGRVPRAHGRSPAATIVCPAEIGRWPLIPEFRAEGNLGVFRSGQVRDGGGSPYRAVCYYQSSAPQPIGALTPGFLNRLEFSWVAPDQQANWEWCGHADQSRFHYSRTHQAQVSVGVWQQEDFETYWNAALAILAEQIEPQAASCEEPRPADVPPPGPVADQDPEPVIFIPGIMGSELRTTGARGRSIWPPAGVNAARAWDLRTVWEDLITMRLPPEGDNVIAVDALRYDGGSPIYGPLIDSLTQPGRYLEYQVDGDPDRRSIHRCDRQDVRPRATLFVFGYDWRLPIEYNAVILQHYVECIQYIHPGRRINIVTHSMGGLVARRFILDHPDAVDKLITIAAPFLGAPKVVFQMRYGLLSVDVNGLLLAQIPEGDDRFAPVREMELSYPGLHQLIASRAYYSLGAPPVTRMDAGVLPGAGIRTDLPLERVVYSQFMGPGGLLDSIFPAESPRVKSVSRSNREFHDYNAPNGNRQDDWSQDNTQVSYFHLIGVQKNLGTPVSLRINMAGTRDPTAPGYTISVVPGPGDGTVPLLSSARIGNGFDFNAPNAQLFIYAGAGALSGNPDIARSPRVTVLQEKHDWELEHASIAYNPRVIAKVLELLGTSTPGSGPLPAAEPVVPVDRGRYRVRYLNHEYLTLHVRQDVRGEAIDSYYYPIYSKEGPQAEQDGQPLWGRFVRVPAFDPGYRGRVLWWAVTWVWRDGVWELVEKRDVKVDVLQREP